MVEGHVPQGVEVQVLSSAQKVEKKTRVKVGKGDLYLFFQQVTLFCMVNGQSKTDIFVGNAESRALHHVENNSR
jgi:hypothetical protein